MERSPSPALEMDYNQYEEEQYSDFPLSTEILPMQLKQETDFLTEWKIMKEFELTDMKKKLEISEAIQQKQRENLLEVQMNCERLSQYLTNELENRELLASRVDSSQEITSVIQHHIGELTTTLESCVHSRDELLILINEQNTRMEHLNNELEEFQILKNSNKNLISKVEDVKKLWLEEKNKLNILREDYDKLKGHLEAIKAHLTEEASLHNKQRQEEQELFQNKLVCLHTEINILQKENKIFFEELEKMKNLEELNKKLFEENEQFKIEIKTLNVKIESSISDLETLRQEILKREEIICSIRSNEASLQGQAQILETLHRELEIKWTSSNDQRNQMEIELIRNKDQFLIEKEQLNSKFAVLEASIVEKDIILKNKESEIKEIEAQFQAREHQIHYLEEKLNSQVCEIGNLEEKCKNLSSQIKKISEINSNLENSLVLAEEKLNKEEQIHEDTKKKWNSQQDELYLRIDQLEASCKTEEKRSNQEIENLRMHSRELADNVDNYRNERDSVRQELDELRTAYNVQEETMRREMDQLLAELRGNFLNKLKAKDSQITELRKEIRDINEKYAQMNHKNFVLESEFKKRKQEVKSSNHCSPPKTRKQSAQSKTRDVIQMALDDSWSEDSNINQSPKKKASPVKTIKSNTSSIKKTYGGLRLSQNTGVTNFNISSRTNQIAENNKKISGPGEHKDKGKFADVMSLLDTSLSS